MNNKNPQTLFLLYTAIKKEISNTINMVLVNESMYVLHAIETINSYTPKIEVNNNPTISQSIEPFIISYEVN